MKKQMFINVQGKTSMWSFHFYGDPKHIEEWRADGLEVFVVENSIPAWIADIPAGVQTWCFFQDIFNFKNPFSGK